jgi:hypothetical protein
MPYGLIIIFAAIGLTIYYAAFTEASRASKAFVVVLLAFCLVSRYWLHRFSMATLFLMLGLSIYISLYRLYIEAISTHRKD